MSADPHHVAVSSQGVLWVAAARLATPLLAVVPVVGGALVTVVANHVFPTGTRPRLPVTVALAVPAGGWDGAGCHAGATWKHTHPHSEVSQTERN